MVIANVDNQHESSRTGNRKGIRTGAEYLNGLQDEREIWTRGQRIEDVTADPGMRRGASTLASMLDRQHDPELRDRVTYIDKDGDRCAMAFQIPRNREDVVARGRAYYEWATWSLSLIHI